MRNTKENVVKLLGVMADAESDLGKRLELRKAIRLLTDKEYFSSSWDLWMDEDIFIDEK